MFALPVWNASLTKQQIVNIEIVQKVFLYPDYYAAHYVPWLGITPMLRQPIGIKAIFSFWPPLKHTYTQKIDSTLHAVWCM